MANIISKGIVRQTAAKEPDPPESKLDAEIERWREMVEADRAKGNLMAARDHGKRLAKLIRQRG